MEAIFKDQTQNSKFLSKGFVKIPLLNNKEVAYLLDEIKNLRPDDNFSPDENAIYGQSFHNSFLDTNIEYKKKTFHLIQDLISPHIKKILNNYRILTCQLFIKPPGKGDLGPHQNINFIPDINDTTIGVFCPLVNIDEHNGAIQVVEGSHKIFPNVATPTVPRYCINFEDAVKEKYSKLMPMKAGESLFFDDSLLHWSKPNYSDSPRYAMVIICVPVESDSVFFYFEKDSPEKGFELFEIDSNFFIENTVLAMLKRPTNLKSIGFVENNNRILTEAEFVELLKKGDKSRQKIYNPNKKKGFLNALKNIFRS